MADDTSIGGASGRFPVTRWSAVVAARSADAAERTRALDALLAAYWKPVYKYIRLRWGKSNEDAKDMTQEFFARLVEKDLLGSYDPARAHLRTYLRTCVDGLVLNEDKAARRLKRGGDVSRVSLDFDAAESELAHAGVPGAGSPDDVLEREWIRSLFAAAVEALRTECEARGKTTHFRLFALYDLEDAGNTWRTYAELAKQFNLPVTDVTNHLAYARREFRRIALEKLREMTATDEEFRREARGLFGVEPE